MYCVCEGGINDNISTFAERLVLYMINVHIGSAMHRRRKPHAAHAQTVLTPDEADIGLAFMDTLYYEIQYSIVSYEEIRGKTTFSFPLLLFTIPLRM